MKKLYIVNVYAIIGGELIDSRTDVVEVLTIHNEMTDETWSEITTKGNRTFRYKHSEFAVEILGENRIGN